MTRFFKRRPKIPIDLLLALPPRPVLMSSLLIPLMLILMRHIVSDDIDELQAGPRYNLRDRSTIHPEDKYGFSGMNAAISEPITY